MHKTILGIVGSYRKGETIDQLVSEVLANAKAAGATTRKIYLTDAHIEFCTNCRQCMQHPGPEPGQCRIADDMNSILTLWKHADALVIGAPINFYNVTAITRRFMERLVCFAYWPWGQPSPRMRTKRQDKQAVLITSSAMPKFMGLFLTGATRALKAIAETMGAKPVRIIYAGCAAGSEHANPPEKAMQQARTAGKHLAL